MLKVLIPMMLVFSSAALGETLFEYNGKTYKSDTVSDSMKQNLHQIEERSYNQKAAFIDDAILDIYFAEQGKKKGKSLEEMKVEMLKSKAPSEKEIKKFYEENKTKIPAGYTFDQVKPEIVRILDGRNKDEIRTKLLEKAKKSGKFSLLLKKPTAPIIKISTKGFPSKGKAGSKVQIVEFADYQCPHCREASVEFRKLMEKYKNKIELVFIDFPINRSGISRVVAEGAYCAKKQDKYWPYHEMAFEMQPKLTKKSPLEMAKKLKLNTGDFEKCLKSAEAKQFVSKGKNEGERVGVGGTPTIFVNGKRFSQRYTFENLKQEVDRLL